LLLSLVSHDSRSNHDGDIGQARVGNVIELVENILRSSHCEHSTGPQMLQQITVMEIISNLKGTGISMSSDGVHQILQVKCHASKAIASQLYLIGRHGRHQRWHKGKAPDQQQQQRPHDGLRNGEAQISHLSVWLREYHTK